MRCEGDMLINAPFAQHMVISFLEVGTHEYTTGREKCLKEEIHQVKLCVREANRTFVFESGRLDLS